MAARQSLYQLTPLDLRRHHRVLEELRRCLFRERTPQECFIVGDEVVLAPSVYVLIDLVTAQPQRYLQWGGLEYQFAFPQARAPRWISVKHWQGKRYWLCASFQDPNKQATYTRFSLVVPFCELGRQFLSCIDVLIQECKPLAPLHGKVPASFE